MLGGVDHAAALIRKAQSQADGALVIGAGPMLFQDPVVAPEGEAQARFKAETMARSLGDIGLVAWAPGDNDWALGQETFSRLAEETRAQPLAANLPETLGTRARSALVRAGGLSVGLVGISGAAPPAPSGQALLPATPDGSEILAQEVQRLSAEGARILIALVTAPRGQALRWIEKVPGLHLVVLGKGRDQGEANDAVFEPILVGRTLVVQGQNHLQGVGIVDLYVRDDSYAFGDGTGLERALEKSRVEARLAELSRRIEAWKQPGSGVSAQDLSQRQTDRARLQARHAELGAQRPPPEGSYFLYDWVAVKEALGQDQQVAARLSAYYQRVNDHNRDAFKDKLPLPVASGESSYVGVDQCTTCHQEERAFWNKTGHANAYVTLSRQHKEFNLDCVSCHVTGYEQPGGSTVTHVGALAAVQCEVCHGPGSRHVANPVDPAFIVKAPTTALCPTCHHSPHVHDDWRAEEAFPKIIGPGHGR